jgi:hypothetical protein
MQNHLLYEKNYLFLQLSPSQLIVVGVDEGMPMISLQLRAIFVAQEVRHLLQELLE